MPGWEPMLIFCREKAPTCNLPVLPGCLIISSASLQVPMAIFCYLWVWSLEDIQKYSRIHGMGLRDNLIWLPAFREDTRHHSGPQYEQWQSWMIAPFPCLCFMFKWATESHDVVRAGVGETKKVSVTGSMSPSIHYFQRVVRLSLSLACWVLLHVQTLALCLPEIQSSHWHGFWADTLDFICSK